ncbi:hypothetical protein [Flavipsychrobacter stenotrophus]|nr:hypothetical protein [Flavipsychrobacter stenotrophus]
MFDASKMMISFLQTWAIFSEEEKINTLVDLKHVASKFVHLEFGEMLILFIDDQLNDLQNLGGHV